MARSEHPSDRRVRQLSLNEKGRTLIEIGIEARRQWLKELTASLSAADQEAISKASLF